MTPADLKVPCAKCNHELTEIIRMQISYQPGTDRIGHPVMLPVSTLYELRCLAGGCGHVFSHTAAHGAP